MFAFSLAARLKVIDNSLFEEDQFFRHRNRRTTL